MNKLIIAAAVAAMTVVGNAALKPSVCPDCGAGNGPQDCDTIVFKVTGSGKAVVDKGAYKTVGNLKIKKGALALEGSICEATGACCYDSGWFFAQVKAGGETYAVVAEVAVDVWSVFGKNLDKSRNYVTEIKPGKKVTLESALFVSTEEGTVDDDYLEGVSFWASSFGKVDMSVTKDGGTGYCKETKGCDPIYTPKTYNGWFVGIYPCVGEEDCFKCDCDDADIFGGTWKAVFQAKRTTLASAISLAGISVSED